MLLGGYPLGGTNWTDALRLLRINNPSQTICIFDAAIGNIASWSNWGGSYTPLRGGAYVSDRHTGGANVLWVDGHVSWHLKDTIVNTSEWWYP